MIRLLLRVDLRECVNVFNICSRIRHMQIYLLVVEASPVGSPGAGLCSV